MTEGTHGESAPGSAACLLSVQISSKVLRDKVGTHRGNQTAAGVTNESHPNLKEAVRCDSLSKNTTGGVAGNARHKRPTASELSANLNAAPSPRSASVNEAGYQFFRRKRGALAGVHLLLFSVALQSTLSGPYHSWVPSSHTVSDQGPGWAEGRRSRPQRSRVQRKGGAVHVSPPGQLRPGASRAESDPRWGGYDEQGRTSDPCPTPPWLPLQARALPFSEHKRPAEGGGATGQTETCGRCTETPEALWNTQGGRLLFRGPNPLLLGPDGASAWTPAEGSSCSGWAQRSALTYLAGGLPPQQQLEALGVVRQTAVVQGRAALPCLLIQVPAARGGEERDKGKGVMGWGLRTARQGTAA